MATNDSPISNVTGRIMLTAFLLRAYGIRNSSQSNLCAFDKQRSTTVFRLLWNQASDFNTRSHKILTCLNVFCHAEKNGTLVLCSEQRPGMTLYAKEGLLCMGKRANSCQ